MVKNEGDPLKQVVVCTPGQEYFNVTDLKTHNFNEDAHQETTVRQHDQLKSLMNHADCEVIDVAELPNHPNSVFTRDVSLVTSEGYIQLRMGLPARRGEEEWMSQILESFHLPCIGKIEAPGIVEGGDVILAGKVAFIGLSGRTNNKGILQLTPILDRMGFESRILPVPSNSLHLGGAMSMLDPETALYCQEAFSSQYFKGYRTVKISCTSGVNGNVISLGNNLIIVNSAENMPVIEILERENYRVKRLNLSEFRKGAGGPTCLILPIERH